MVAVAVDDELGGAVDVDGVSDGLHRIDSAAVCHNGISDGPPATLYEEPDGTWRWVLTKSD